MPPDPPSLRMLKAGRLKPLTQERASQSLTYKIEVW